MEADNKENISAYGQSSRGLSKTENSDHNKSVGADVNGTTPVTDEAFLPIDLSTEKKINAAGVDNVADRWINKPLDCEADFDENEIFFGDVTNKEIKKSYKYKSRKTAVFVPGFRLDRRMMRYTMCPPTSDHLDETEKLDDKVGIGNGASEESAPIEKDDTQDPVDEVHGDESSNKPVKKEVSVETLIVELRDIEDELNGIRVVQREDAAEDMGTKLLSNEVQETKPEVFDSKDTVPDDGCIKVDENVEEYETLISEVINESLQEDKDNAIDCSLLLPEESAVVPYSSHSPCESSESSSVDDSDSEDEEAVNREIVNNMLKALDRRTAILSALARMQKHPENNPNTKGKPESFEKMLQAHEEHGQPCNDNSDSESGLTETKRTSGLTERKENGVPEIGDMGDIDSQRLVVQLQTNLLYCSAKNAPCDENKLSNDIEELNLEHDNESCQIESDKLVGLKGTECERNDCTLITVQENSDSDSDIKVEKTLPANDNLTFATLEFSNRSNNNSNESEVALDIISKDLSHLSLGTLSGPNSDLNVIPVFPDDRDLPIDTFGVTGQIDDLAAILPELDVDDIINVLKEEPECELFTPQRETGAASIVADGNLMHNRVVGGNTVVVASNNFLCSPSGTMAYHSLPEFPTRIGATHTVTSVCRPISSPGAVRCQRRYRSIYATLPSETLVEIETQVVPECPQRRDLFESFGKLDINELGGAKCGLDDSVVNSTYLVLPIVNQKDSFLGDDSLCSSKCQSPNLQTKQLHTLQNECHSVAGCLAGAEGSLFSPVPKYQSSPKFDSEVYSGFSPSVVFTERNFSPILQVNFPPSPSVDVPAALQCTEHTSVPLQSASCASQLVSRDKKRKQPAAENQLQSRIPTPTNTEKSSSKVKPSLTKAHAPRTPPKKVIGSPTIHKFHTAFGKNPASKSLLHQFGIHVSPRPGLKATPKSSNRVRSKSPVSARRMLDTPKQTTRTPNNRLHDAGVKSKTPQCSKPKSSSFVKTPSSAKAPSTKGIKGTPGKTSSSLMPAKKTPAKTKQTLDLVGSVQKSSGKKYTSTSGAKAVRSGPIKELFGRSALAKQTNSICRRVDTPGGVGHRRPYTPSNFGCQIWTLPQPSFLPEDNDEEVVRKDLSTDTNAGAVNADGGGSPRLSMEDVLQRQKEQMITLRAEKRKINDIRTRHGSPTIKSVRANNRVPRDPLLKQRLANTQTLSLTDKELDAVTQVHTLCNSQRTVKVIHKGRAMIIRQVPQSPRLPDRISWDKNITVEISEDESQSPGSSPEHAASPPKPILTRKDVRFIYPFDDERPTPVVVFRTRSGDRHVATRSPRID